LQFNAKLADLELGVTETARGNSKDRAAYEKQRAHTQTSNMNNNGSGNLHSQNKLSAQTSRNNWGSFIMNVSSSADGESDLDSSASINPAAGVLAADEFLANWAAPEVITNGIHVQASDVYSLSLVLWELITGCVPFNETPRQDDIRQRVLAGKQNIFDLRVIVNQYFIIRRETILSPLREHAADSAH
jgi:hypothetical protein